MYKENQSYLCLNYLFFNILLMCSGMELYVLMSQQVWSPQPGYMLSYGNVPDGGPVH